MELLEDSGLDQIREWIYCHHERPDGSGYPRGLSGDEIPLEARILAVADAYEAMTNDRVYRAGYRACEELRRNVGTRSTPARRSLRAAECARPGQSSGTVTVGRAAPCCHARLGIAGTLRRRSAWYSRSRICTCTSLTPGKLHSSRAACRMLSSGSNR